MLRLELVCTTIRVRGRFHGSPTHLSRTAIFPEWNEPWRAAIFELEHEQQHLTWLELERDMEGDSKKVGHFTKYETTSGNYIQLSVTSVVVLVHRHGAGYMRVDYTSLLIFSELPRFPCSVSYVLISRKVTKRRVWGGGSSF